MRKTAFILLILFFLQGCRTPGRKFYPIGIYTVPNEKTFSDARCAGFNTVLIYDTEPEVIIEAEKLAERSGLKLVCYPGNYPSLDGSFDPNRVDPILNELRNSKNILAWYLYDEPEVHDLRSDHLYNFNLYIKERSPRIPTAFVVGNGEKYRNYAGCSDIAMLDWYPIPLYPLESIAHHITECRAYTGRDQPIWMVLQAFDWTPFSETVRCKGTGRIPTFEELRFMTFLSVVEGVDGLFYWAYRTPKDEWIILDHPELWEDLNKVVKELNDYYAFLISKKRVEGVRVDENPTASRGRIRCLLKKVARSDLRRAVRINRSEIGDAIKAGYYLLAVNSSADSIEVTFSKVRVGNRNVEELFSGDILELKSGTILDELSAYEVSLYYLGL